MVDLVEERFACLWCDINIVINIIYSIVIIKLTNIMLISILELIKEPMQAGIVHILPPPHTNILKRNILKHQHMLLFP